MKSASAFVLASEREGFGMVVLESMAAGTPVVVAKGANSAAPDLVTDSVDGFVVEPEVSEIARALARLVSDRQLAQEMGNAGKTKAALYGWDAIVNKTERLYMDLVGIDRSAELQDDTDTPEHAA